MKRELVILLAFVFLLPFLSSASINMKDNYSQGETLIAKISGNFVEPILEENVVFYKDHVKIPMIYEVGKIGNSFYVAAYLTSKDEGNYSIKLQNVYYYSGASVIGDDLVKNFSITNETADFYLDRGFVITEDPFFVEITGLKDYDVEVSITSSEEFVSDESATVSSGESKKIDFSFGNISDEFVGSVSLKSENTNYTIPVYFYGTAVSQGYCGDGIINSGEQCDGKNWGDVDDCTDFNFELGDLSCVDCQFDTSDCKDSEVCDNYECVEIEPECTKDSECTGDEVCDNGICVECKSADNCGNDERCVNNLCVTTEQQQTCEELKGEFCTKENCNGEFKDIRGNICCLGSCEAKKPGSSTAWIGWTLLIVVFLILIFFYFKYRGSKAKPVDFSKIFKK